MNRVTGVNRDGSRNFDHWKHYDPISLHEASLLWSDLNPGTEDELEDHATPSIRSKGLLQRVLDGTLNARLAYKDGPSGEKELDWLETKLTRRDMALYAKKVGDEPAFLRDDIRRLDEYVQQPGADPEVMAHTTELIELQKKAIRHFFVEQKQSNPEPTRKEIVDWLHSNGCSSKNAAQAIASVIMPKYLKQGGRRKTKSHKP